MGMAPKRIAILGSTGSIGRQALEVIAAHPDELQAEVLTAHSNGDLLAEQALRFKPNAVVIGDEKQYPALKEKLWDQGIKVFAGHRSVEQIVQLDNIDMVLAAMVGYAGLRSTLAAISAGKNIALANKETLVVAGELIMQTAFEKRVVILPV